MIEIIVIMLALYWIGALAWSLFTAYPILFIIALLVGGYYFLNYLAWNSVELGTLLFIVEGAGTGFVVGWIMKCLSGEENILYNFISRDYIPLILTIVGLVIGVLAMMIYVDTLNSHKLSGELKEACYRKYIKNTLFASVGIETAFCILIFIATGAVLVFGIVVALILWAISYVFHLF